MKKPSKECEGAKSWACCVQGTGGDEDWAFNGVRYPLTDEGYESADNWGRGLLGRWMGAKNYEVVQTTDEPVGCWEVANH